jgi:hypothetical protein
MRRAGLAIVVVCMLLGAVILSYSASPFLPQTSDPADITVTYIVAFSTQVNIILGTPIPPFMIDSTVTSLAPTRTAVALTRNPLLAISPTPNPIQLTVSHMMNSGMDSLNETATHIVARATATQATLLGTIVPTFPAAPPMMPSPCHLSRGNTYQDDLSAQVQTAISNAGIQNTFVTIITEGVLQPAGCGTPFSPLTTYFSILIETDQIKILAERLTLADFTAAILDVLTEFPLQESYGPESTRLIITFELGVYHRRVINTGYANALAAYEEGLRGEALLEALGGILPP